METGTRWRTEDRIQALAQLGKVLHALLNDPSSEPIAEAHHTTFLETMQAAAAQNPWFTEPMVRTALGNLVPWLEEEALHAWVQPYGDRISPSNPKRVAVIQAGNVPLVGFHDMLSVLITGHSFLGKLSSKDALLPAFVGNLLKAIDPRSADHIAWTQGKLTDFDAVIATGSGNSSRYFEYYFGSYPHIIRKNRNSLAVLNGDEDKASLEALSQDIFTYFGLGCRNVSKILVPEQYAFEPFFEAMYGQRHVFENNKYHNNYNYQRSIYLLNQEEGLLDNHFLLLKPDAHLASPVGVLFYSRYRDEKEKQALLNNHKPDTQCVVGAGFLPFGSTQQPSLQDYADDVNSLEFLTSIS